METEREKQKVLIVDDRRENIVFLANNILRPKGYEVITAMDGEKGLRKALEEKPDLIIMDLRMPKMNGLEVLAALRREQCQIPVILTTFHGSESVAIEAFRLGIKDYIIKPYTVEDMEKALERALGAGQAEGKVQRESEPAEELKKEIQQELNQQWERRIKELNTFHDIGKAVISLLDLEKITNRVVEAAVFLTGAEEGFLLLVDPQTEELYMRAAQGFSQKEARSFRIKVKDSLSGQVITTGKPIMVNNVQKQVKLKTGYLVKSLLHVPMKFRDKVIGVLSVHNRVSSKAFTNGDLRALTILAGYAAVAVENARAYQNAAEKARQLSQLLNTQQSEKDAEKITQLVREIEVYEQQLKKSREEAEYLVEELRTLTAAAENLAKRLKVQEKEAEDLAKERHTP